MENIPEITLKKVGKDREKKKGGLPLFGGGRGAQAALRGATGAARGGAGAFGGALGGSGGGFAATLAARLGSQVAMRLLLGVAMSALVGGAWGVGKAMKPSGKKAPRAFSDVASMKARDAKKYDNADNLPANHNYQSGLAMVSGSLGGKTPEELAAERAAAEKAAAEAAAKEQSATADPQAAAAGAMPDPAAMAAAAAGGEAAAGGKKEAFGSRFGSLSSSFGGGGGSKLAGGSGLSNGLSGKFDTAKLGAGLRGFGNGGSAPRSSGKAPIRGNGGPRGLAARQLNNAFRAGQQARGQSGTGASYTAGQPFDNGMGTDKLIADPAAAPGAPGTRGGTSGSSGGGGGGSAGTPNSVGSGFGGETIEDDCTKILPDTFGDNVKGVTYENSPQGGCVMSTDGGGDASPWGSMVNIATTLTKVALILCTIAAIVGMFGNIPIYGAYFRAAAMYIAYAAAALAAIAALLGIAIMAQGNLLGGGVITAVAGITAVGAFVAAQGIPAAGTQVAVGTTALVGLASASAYALMEGFDGNGSADFLDKGDDGKPRGLSSTEDM